MWYQKNTYLCSVLINKRLFYRFKKAKKMKKLVLMFVAIAAISFASCGNKTAAPAANADSDTVQVADTTVDTTAVAADTTVAE